MNAPLRTVHLLRDRPRPFTPADKSMIKRLHGFMPAQQLLELLNERLEADRGPEEVKHTMEQLFAEIGEAADEVPADGHDWSSLRKLLAKARRAGTLAAVTSQLIDDFAVVYSLSPAQVLHLQDVLLRAREGE